MVEGKTQSILILTGMASGVAVITYISALMASLQINLIEKTLGSQSQVTISAPLDLVHSSLDIKDLIEPPRKIPIEMAKSSTPTRVLEQIQPRPQKLKSPTNWNLLMPILEATPGVAAVSPKLAFGGLAIRGEVIKAIAITGIELDRYDRIVQLRSKIVDGYARLEPGEAMLGLDLAFDLGVRVGDRLNITVGSTSDLVRVTAILDYGVRDLNRQIVVLPLRTAQSLAKLPGGITSLELSLVDLWSASDYAQDFARRWNYKVESWQEANPQLVSALTAQSVSTAIIRGVVLIVVILGIASVLIVSVLQKRREIGILRAMGATRRQIMRVFLVQGVIIGALGSALGIVLAWALIAAFMAFVRGDDGEILFNITLPPLLAITVAAIALLSGVLAAVAPSWRAARLDPAQAIRL